MIKHCHRAQAGLEIDLSLLRRAEKGRATGGGSGVQLVPPTGHCGDHLANTEGVDQALPPTNELTRSTDPPTLQGRR